MAIRKLLRTKIERQQWLTCNLRMLAALSFTVSCTGVNQLVGGELYAAAVNNPSGSFANTFNQYVEGENTSGTWCYYGDPDPPLYLRDLTERYTARPNGLGMSQNESKYP